MSTTTGPLIFGATTEGSPNEICRLASNGVIEVFSHEESDVAQLARTAAQLMKERDEVKAYSQQVVVNIAEEMNELKAGNARLLRELEELRKDKARLDFIDAQKEPKSFYASRQAIDLDMEGPGI